MIQLTNVVDIYGTFALITLDNEMQPFQYLFLVFSCSFKPPPSTLSRVTQIHNMTRSNA